MRGWWFWIAAAAAFLLWPKEMDAGGLLEDVAVLLGAVAIATPLLVYDAIRRNLPEDVPLAPAGPHEVPPEVDDVVREYEDLGFVRAGPPLRVELPRPAILVPLLRAEEGMLATVFRIDARPSAKLGYDVVSLLDSPASGVTTGMDPGAGVLPAPRGILRQIFPGAPAADLVARHREALRFVESHGRAPVGAAASAIPHLLKQSFALQRREFLRAPVVHTFTALWRTIVRRNPHLAPLEAQAGAAERIRAMPRMPAPRRRTVARP